MNIIDLYEKYDNLYYVGGVVRDILLKKPSEDVDITVLGNAIDFCKSLDFGEILQINPDFGTVKMRINNHDYDFASTRKEVYEKKGHLPKVVEIGCSLEEDVKRRDFTINAIAKNTKTDEIIDYLGGREDLANKKLRVLHDESFIDDPTRILRGLKFAVRFGFSLEEHTEILQENYLKNVNYDMSYKRLKDELISTFNLNSNKAMKIFIEKKMYKLLSESEVFITDYDIQTLVGRYFRELKNIWLVYMALVDISKLELTKIEQKIVDDFNKVKSLKFKSDFEVFKAFENCEIETVLLYEIVNANGLAQKYLDELRHVKLQIDGEDLKMLGIEPSAQYGEIFDAVLKEKLRNPKMSKDEEIDIVKSLSV